VLPQSGDLDCALVDSFNERRRRGDLIQGVPYLFRYTYFLPSTAIIAMQWLAIPETAEKAIELRKADGTGCRLRSGREEGNTATTIIASGLLGPA